MRDTNVKMKDGRIFCGPIWEWRPVEGWFSIVDTEGLNGGNPIRIELRDVEEAETGPRDELQRASDESGK